MSQRSAPGPGQTVDLPSHPSSAGAARRFVAAHLKRMRLTELSEVAELLVSELVTNSLLHARTNLRVELLGAGGTVRIAVHDESRVPSSRWTAVEDRLAGRGLLLVDSLARDWGSESTDWGKSTWFVLAAEATPDGEDDGGGLVATSDG